MLLRSLVVLPSSGSLTHHEHHLGELDAVDDEVDHLLVSSDLTRAGHVPSVGLCQQGRRGRRLRSGADPRRAIRRSRRFLGLIWVIASGSYLESPDI